VKNVVHALYFLKFTTSITSVVGSLSRGDFAVDNTTTVSFANNNTIKIFKDDGTRSIFELGADGKLKVDIWTSEGKVSTKFTLSPGKA
jgi:hypothetical protein